MSWTKTKGAIVSGCALLAAGMLAIAFRHPTETMRIQGIPKDWSVLRGESDQWNWVDNAIIGHTITGDSILGSSRQYGDVTLSGMVSTTNREASLALRLQGPEDGYIAVFAPDGVPAAEGGHSKIVLIRRIAGEEREIGIFKRRKLSGPGQFEKLTFAAKGPQLEVCLDDIPVIKTNDTTFTSGFIGLRIYGDPKIPCDGVFSNLVVRYKP